MAASRRYKVEIDSRTEKGLRGVLKAAIHGGAGFQTLPTLIRGQIEADEDGLILLLKYFGSELLDDLSRLRFKRKILSVLEDAFAHETNHTRLRKLMDTIIALEEMKFSEIGSCFPETAENIPEPHVP
jgi:hypothetical protein